MPYLKNIPIEEKLKLKDLVEVKEGQVISRTLVQNDAISITIFAFPKGEELSEHTSTGDALVFILDGEGEFIINKKPFKLKKEESIVMPADIPHAVKATDNFKMLLIQVFN